MASASGSPPQQRPDDAAHAFLLQVEGEPVEVGLAAQDELT
ncbi:MAG: hypothetical protein OXF93_00975 [Acidobacteria bacterium]|nr:hypothetical protein [Acidobacteriota bacterium]